MSELTKVVGHVVDSKVASVTWDVWSDGRASADGTTMYPLYRWPDGTWRTAIVSSRSCVTSDSSPQLEDVFQAYIASIVVTPIDLTRHRK